MLCLRYYYFVVLYSVISFSVFGQNIRVQTDNLTKAPPLTLKEQVQSLAREGRAWPPQELNSICFDSSRNGYGWASSTPKPIDYSMHSGWLGAAYRMFVPGDPQTGIPGMMEYFIAHPFDPSSIATYDLRPWAPPPNFNIRYPIYLSTDTTSIVLVTNYSGLGSTEIWLIVTDWDSPFFSPLYQQIPLPYSSFWVFSADIIQIFGGGYHIGLIGKVDLNTGTYVFVSLASADGINWTVADTAQIATQSQMNMNTPRFAWGVNGFGAWASTGHFTNNPDQQFKLILSTTSDYGQSWSAPQRIEWSDLGFPEQIVLSDSIYIPDFNIPGDSLLYVGPAQVGITYDFDLIIAAQNELHFGCTVIWGPQIAPNSYYPHRRWSGLYDLHSADGGATWAASRIWRNAGLLASDSTGAYVFTNEIDLGKDELDNIYAAWVDRDRFNPVPSPYPRSNPYIFNHYNLDVWASRSLDGGQSWSYPPLRVTNNQQVCHYGLKLSPRTKNDAQNNGRILIVYQIADLTRPLPPPVEILADHVNWLYLAEAKNFPVPTRIEKRSDENIPANNALLQNYPNPFNNETMIGYRLLKSGEVELAVFNLLGQKVRILFSGKQTAGEHRARWDGRDDTGREVASGVYIYRLSIIPPSKGGRGDVQTRKMLLVR